VSFDQFDDEGREEERERVLDERGADYAPPPPIVFPHMLQLIISEAWAKAVEGGKRFPRVTWCSGARMWRWKSHRTGRKHHEAQRNARNEDEPGEWGWFAVPITASGGVWEYARRDKAKPYRIRSDGSDIIEWMARKGECTAPPGTWHVLDTCPFPLEPDKDGIVRKERCKVCEQRHHDERMLYKAWCQKYRPAPEEPAPARRFKKGGFGR
jgi:hypothetical protein